MPHATAARHATRLLQLLARHAEPQPAAALARDLGLPRSTTYHVLTVLRDAGFVVHLEDDRRWGLGVAALELGSAYSRQVPLQRLARPVLARLVESTTHNAHLAILHGKDLLYVVQERAPRRPSLVTDVGVRLPAEVTASGLALLAALPPQQVRALYPSRAAFVQRNGRGPTSLTALRSELAQVRRRGHARETDAVTEGFASVAHVATDHNGMPAASIAVTWATWDVDDAEVSSLVARCRRAADELTARLGGRPSD